jgi:hypothetical protein
MRDFLKVTAGILALVFVPPVLASLFDLLPAPIGFAVLLVNVAILVWFAVQVVKAIRN